MRGVDKSFRTLPDQRGCGVPARHKRITYVVFGRSNVSRFERLGL
jgi:hypothetical protein